MGLAGMAFWAGTFAVAVPEAQLRSACDGSSEVVARLPEGQPLRIRFSLAGEAGTCYKVAADSGGREVSGYLPAASVAGREEFEKARLAGRAIDQPSPPPARTVSPASPGTAAPSLVTRASRLLATHQPAEALTLLEQALAAEPRNASLLAMAGLAARQSDRIGDAVHYWRQALAQAPNPVVERRLRDAEREQGADKSAQALIGMRFTFRYDDRTVSPEQARSLVPVLDAEYARISERLGCPAGERLAAIIQSPEDYRRTTGAAEWSGAQYDGRIHVALLEPVPGAETRRSFSHEIVHACLAALGDWPVWLHEGLAQRLSGETLAPDARAAVIARARRGELPSLGKLGRTWSRLSPEHAQVAYALAYLAAELLETHYGTDGIRNLLQNPGMLSQVTADLDKRLRP